MNGGAPGCGGIPMKGGGGMKCGRGGGGSTPNIGDLGDSTRIGEGTLLMSLGRLDRPSTVFTDPKTKGKDSKIIIVSVFE